MLLNKYFVTNFQVKIPTFTLDQHYIFQMLVFDNGLKFLEQKGWASAHLYSKACLTCFLRQQRNPNQRLSL